MESGVDLLALNMPEAPRFTLHIMAAAAEQEACASATGREPRWLLQI